MRKFAHCPECKKRRAIEVEAECIATFDPRTGYAIVHGFGDVVARCSVCYHSVHLSMPKEELEELLKAATEAVSGL